MLDYIRRVLENANRHGWIAFFFLGFGDGVILFIVLYLVMIF